MAEVLADIGGGRVLPGLGRIALAKLSPTDVQAFLNARLVSGLTPRRVQMCHAVPRQALRTAETWVMGTRNVAKVVDAPESFATASRS